MNIGNMKSLVLIPVLFCLAYICNAIEVQGHLTRDTVWMPEYNPYIVTGYIYVDAGITLTILPGVQIYVNAADANYNENGFIAYGNNEALAKKIIVYGKLIAKGTSADPIVFDRLQTGATHRWGGIYIFPDAPKAEFEYCNINNTFKGYVPSVGLVTGAINFKNGRLHIRNCSFTDNYCSLYSDAIVEDLLIYKVRFSGEQRLSAFTQPTSYILAPIDEYHQHLEVTIARCLYTGVGQSGLSAYLKRRFLFNKVINIQPVSRLDRWIAQRSVSYGNHIENAWGCQATANASFDPNATDTVYCRRNTIIQPYSHEYTSGIYASGDRTIVSDNFCYGKVMMFTNNTGNSESKYHNNIIMSYFRAIEFTYAGFGTDTTRVYNNIFVSLEGGPLNYRRLLTMPFRFVRFFNNTCYAFSKIGTGEYNLAQNNIFAFIPDNGDNNMSFSHNLLSTPLPIDYPYDLGGNLIGNPVFMDAASGNYELQADSPCIDAGSTMPDLPVYDYRYHLRVSGNAPDMGAFEYNSPYIGGIRAYVYDAQTQNPLDCAEVRISGKLPEYSDSLGNVVYHTGAGNWTVHVKRWDYADVTISNVNVTLNDTLWLFIPMQSTVNTIDPFLPNPVIKLTINSHPNPFRSEVKLSYNLPQAAETSLFICNIKGQVVRELTGHGLKGYNTILWDGKNKTGQRCSNGVYIVKLISGNQVAFHKLLMLK